jgi:hypothetical protein
MRSYYEVMAEAWQRNAASDHKEMCIARNNGNHSETIKWQQAAAFSAMIARRRLFAIIGNGETE